MFFGLYNSPATFQAYINDTCHDFINKGWLIIYMNDMLIHLPNNLTLHQKCTKQVFQYLQEQQLTLKLSECSLNSTNIEYLGLFIFPGSIKMDPVKLTTIKE